MGCDPGEVVNIWSALSSAYKRKFGRVGEWKESADGSTEGSPLNAIEVTEEMKYYHREKIGWTKEVSTVQVQVHEKVM